MRNLLFFFLIALAPVLGCTESMIIIGGADADTDAGAGIDSATPVDVGTAIVCGANTCQQGTECCNASCGVCVEPGASCTTIACAPPVVCDGNVCADTAVCCGGCPGQPSTCSDADGTCPAIGCPSTVCGGEVCADDSMACCAGCDGEELCATDGVCDILCPSEPCDAQEVRFEGGCEPGLRYWWNGSSCIGDTGCECVGTDCEATFGDLATCEAAYSTCTMPPVDCDVDNARGQGDCRVLFGYAWNGFSCHAVSGCECVGHDCASLHESGEACEATHGSCGPPPTCESDRECGTDAYCDSCARGSCEACEDCVSGCITHSCEGDGLPTTCDLIEPECGEQGVAIAYDGCWTCVNVWTCDPLDDPEM